MKKLRITNFVLLLAALISFGQVSCKKEMNSGETQEKVPLEYLDESHPEKIWNLTATKPNQFIGEPMPQWALDELKKSDLEYAQMLREGRVAADLSWYSPSFDNFTSTWATQSSLFGHSWDVNDYGPRLASGINYGSLFDLYQVAPYPSWNPLPGYSTAAHTFGNIMSTNTSLAPNTLNLIQNPGTKGIGPDPDFGFNNAGSYLKVGVTLRDKDGLLNPIFNHEIIMNNSKDAYRLNINGTYDKYNAKELTSISIASGTPGVSVGLLINPATNAVDRIAVNINSFLFKLSPNGTITEMKVNYENKVTTLYSELQMNSGHISVIGGGITTTVPHWVMDAVGGSMLSTGTSSDKVTVTLTGQYNPDGTNSFIKGSGEFTTGPLTGNLGFGYHGYNGVTISSGINIKF
ncbi:MAG: hypothetical protein WAT19_07260 [Ferruginibacter sp.]